MKRHPLLNYTEKDVTVIRSKFGLNSGESLKKDILTIKDWFQKQPHLVDAGIDEDVIERILFLAKGSLEVTKQRIERLYTLKGLTPEIRIDRDTRAPRFKKLHDSFRYVPLPKLYNSCRITVTQFTDSNPDSYDFETTLKLGFMLADLRLKYDYSSGDIFVYDFANTSFGHLTKLNIFLMKKCETLFQEGYRSRMEAIHVLNAPVFLDKLVFIMKQVINPKIMARLMIHQSYEEFHKHIPKEYLPEDFGGTQQPLEKLAEMWRQDLESDETRNFFLNSEQLCSNENKRLRTAHDNINMEGSFRKLELD